MKLRLLAATVAALILTTGIASAQDTTTEKGKVSYYFGYQFGRDLAESGEQVDLAAVYKALQDGYAKKPPTLTEEQLRPAVQAMQKRQQAKMEQAKANYEKAAAENKTKSDQYMAQNKAKPGIKSLPGGVQYRVIENGTGAKPTTASTIDLEVLGPFGYGQRPPEATNAKAQPLTGIKMSEVEMTGMREALQQMPAGSKWEVFLPPDKAYGANPRSPYPPNVVVTFEVKLVSVK
jgi:peptidylprolyl isomerase